jgi:hypothetical protein
MKLLKHKEFNGSTIFSIFLFTPEILQCALLITTLKHPAIVPVKNSTMSVENPVFTLVSLQYCCDNNMVKHTSKSLYFHLPLKWRLSWIKTQLISDTYIFRIIIISEWAGIAKSVWRPATWRTVGESNPGGGEIFRSLLVWTWVLYNVYWVSFPG